MARRTRGPVTPSVAAVPERLDVRQLFAGGGLTAEHFQGRSFDHPVLVRTDPAVRFNRADHLPDPAVGRQGFAARWTGRVTPDATGPRTFAVAANAPAKLCVNGNLIVDTAADITRGTVDLTAGTPADVRLEYSAPPRAAPPSASPGPPPAAASRSSPPAT